MGLESGTYVSDLVTSNPTSTDLKSQGDDHLRLIKATLQASFPNASRAQYGERYSAKTGNYTVAATDKNATLGCATAGGAFTITLPTLTSSDDGFCVWIFKTDFSSNLLTVAPAAGTLNDETSLVIRDGFTLMRCFWSGSVWRATRIPQTCYVSTLTASATIDETRLNGVVLAAPASANMTLTLPAAVNYIGRTLLVKLSSSTYTCTLDGNGSETIDGATTWALENDDEFVHIISDGSNWHVVALKSASVEGVPVGAGTEYWGTTAPSGWLFCYGQAVSRTTYANLFGKLSTTYGVGDGSTTFNLPDVRGRVIAGQDDMGGSSANRLTNQTGGLDGDTLGATGGSETHTLTEAQMPLHGHPARISSGGASNSVGGFLLDADNDANRSAYTGTPTETIGQQIGGTGGGAAHNNIQPTIIANYIIKY
jgi:microcystin-dependent protein